jgi:hypothetical protein
MKILPKNLTNYDTLIRKLILKNSKFGNFLLPPSPARSSTILEKKD